MRFRNQEQTDEHTDYTNSNMPRACGSYNQIPLAPLPQQGYQLPQYPMQMPLPSLPTGFPTGGTPTPLLPANAGIPAAPITELTPATLQSPLFTPGFLKTQIGKNVRVSFLIGTNLLTDRTGTLLGVGASYILLRPIDSDDVEMCDIYSIKFVTIIH